VPVPGLVGRTAAAPILFDAFARTGSCQPPCRAAERRAGVRATQSFRYRCGDFARWANWSGPAGEAGAADPFPLNGSRIDVDRSGGAQFSAMPVKVAGGVLPMTMLVNGVAVGEIDGRRQRLVEPPRSWLCPIDRDRRYRRCGHSCHQIQ